MGDSVLMLILKNNTILTAYALHICFMLHPPFKGTKTLKCQTTFKELMWIKILSQGLWVDVGIFACNYNQRGTLT